MVDAKSICKILHSLVSHTRSLVTMGLCIVRYLYLLAAISSLIFNSDRPLQTSNLHYSTADIEFRSLCQSSRVVLILSLSMSRSTFSKCRAFQIFILLLLLSGDIELNPGPTASGSTSQFSICSLNIRSLANQDHLIYLHDIAESHKFNCFCLTETWLSSNTTPSEYGSLPPHGYEIST